MKSGDEMVARSRNRGGEGKDGGGEVETETKTERVKTVAAQGFSGGLCLFPAKMRCYGGGGDSGEISWRRWWLETLAVAAFSEVLF
ncbi:hypothetical protein Hanom_Chr14g01317931 [Helianthus anomalus]